MMTQKDFNEKIVAWMEDRTGSTYRVHEMIKNNDLVLYGLSEEPVQRNVSIFPNLYLNEYYEEYINGDMSFAGMASVIENRYLSVKKENHNFQIDDVLNYEKIKDKIVGRVVNLEKNQMLLQNVPYKVIAGDLAMTYRYVVEHNSSGIASSLINNREFEHWGISKEELHEAAMKNTERMFPVKIQSMKQTIMEHMPEDISDEMRDMLDEMPDMNPEMYIVSNDVGLNGATTMFYPGVNDKLKEIFHEDVLALPSSIHEFIVIPKSMMSREEAVDLVEHANHTAVLPQDYLSSNIYEFDGDELVSVNENENYQDINLEDYEMMDDGMEPEM